MNQSSVLHLFGWDKKFVLPFRDFIHKHFADGNHQFIIYGDVTDGDVAPSSDTNVMPSVLKNALSISMAMKKADKIIIHGLFSNRLLYLLVIQPWLLKKCYWVIWGGDLYESKAERVGWKSRFKEVVRWRVIKNMGYLVSGNFGDIENVKNWYGFKGGVFNSVFYTSNIFTGKSLDFNDEQKAGIRILVGNSASESNRHFLAFDKIYKAKNNSGENNIEVVVPLSYGNESYCNEVERYGREKFGDGFFPILDFMAYDEYLKVLDSIDIVFFNHGRQQGFGSLVQLIGFGKKVYISKESSLWGYFDSIGVTVFDVEDFDLTPITKAVALKNHEVIKHNFSVERVLSGMMKVFN